MYMLSSEEAEEAKIKLPTSIGSSKKQQNSIKKKKIYFIDYTKAFYCVDHNKLLKILQEMEIADYFTCLLRNWYAGKEATVRIRHGKRSSKLRKEYVKAVYCHPVYLTFTQSIS